MTCDCNTCRHCAAGTFHCSLHRLHQLSIAGLAAGLLPDCCDQHDPAIAFLPRPVIWGLQASCCSTSLGTQHQPKLWSCPRGHCWVPDFFLHASQLQSDTCLQCLFHLRADLIHEDCMQSALASWSLLHTQQAPYVSRVNRLRNLSACMMSLHKARPDKK